LEKKLKIGIVCYPTYGGSGVMATELGKALADHGHFVHFITYKQPFRLDAFHPQIFYHEVTFQNYALFEYPPYETALASRMVDICKSEHLDLLHVHYAIPHASAAFMAQQILKSEGIHMPFITTLHGTDITLVGKDPSFLPVVKFSIEHSDAVTCVSESLKKDTIDHFNIQKSVEVIYNFVDFQRFDKKNRTICRSQISKDSDFIITHISNFRKVKRVDDIVRMFAIVHQSLPSKLLMVGDGPERARCEDLARELNIHQHIVYTGKQEAIEELLALSDLFVMSSETESFGLAALEAMACRVPVISTNTGGLPEINIHGKTGYMADVGDYQTMANYCIDLLKNPTLWNEMRENAYSKSLEFSLESILPQYEKLYYSIVNS
jgi:N-acetyl-alpha-D-glucosaminyl L-malate synthase BshA